MKFLLKESKVLISSWQRPEPFVNANIKAIFKNLACVLSYYRKFGSCPGHKNRNQRMGMNWIF